MFRRSLVLWGAWALLSAASFSQAAEFTAKWIGTTDGNWSDAANWETKDSAGVSVPGKVPNNSAGDVYDVIWDAHPVTISLDQPVTIRNFTIASHGTLTGDFDFTVGGNFQWSPGGAPGGATGTIAGKGTFAVKGDAEILPGQGFGGSLLYLRSRVLSLGGTTIITVPLQLDEGAIFKIEASGLMELSLGRIFGSGNVENAGMIRFIAGSGTYSFDTALVNHATIEVQGRTVNFQRSFSQDAGLFLFNGGQVIGVLDIRGGTLAGKGEAGSVLVSSDGRPAVLSGQLKIGQLSLFPNAKLSITLGGRTEGTFDAMSVSGLGLGTFPPSSPTDPLEIRFANDFQRTVQPTDVFPIISISSRASGGPWPPVGHRVETSGGYGSFLVDQLPGETGSIVLRDFIPLPLGISFSEAPVIYPLPNPPGFSIPVNPTATVRSRSDVNWTGGTLLAKITQNFVPGEDVVEATYGSNELAFTLDVLFGGHVRFRGVPFALTVPLLTGDGISWVFNAQTTSEAVQALVRSLVFRNKQFSADIFTQWDSSYPTRVIELEFSSSANQTAKFRKQVVFPVLVGTYMFEDPEDDVIFMDSSFLSFDVFGKFSDGFSGYVPHLSVTWLGCVPNLLEEFDNRSFLNAGGTSGWACALIGQTGPWQFHQCISTYGDSRVCPISIARILRICHGDLNRFGSPVVQARSAPSLTPISLANFRALEVLMRQTSEGGRLRDLYYQHGSEVVRLFVTAPGLATKAISLLSGFQPAVNQFLAGKGRQVQISQALIDELNDFWLQLSDVASPELKGVLETERARFNGFQQFVGKDFVQWAELLKIPSPAQAWIHASSPAFANGQFTVEANYIDGLAYSLWSSPDLATPAWQPVANANLQVNGYTVTLTDPTPSAANVFYQIRAQQKLGASSDAQFQPAALLNDPKLSFPE